MRYPKFLKKNGVIGLCAPSFGLSSEPYLTRAKTAISIFNDLGYKVIAGCNAYKEDEIGASSSALNRAKELMEMYSDSSIDVLVSCGGGERMIEILSYLDFDLLAKKEPKWFMGFSDNTNFTFYLTTLADVASIYGQCFPSFGRIPWHESCNDAIEVIKGKCDIHSYKMYEPFDTKEDSPTSPYKCSKKVCIEHLTKQEEINVSGRLIGGCLDVLVNGVGTKFDKVKEFSEKYRKDGIIFYLEACELNSFAILRSLWQLKNAGWFNNTKAFIFGRSMLENEYMGLTPQKAIMDVLSDLNVPIIYGADIGHLPPTMAIINGCYATIRSKDNYLTIKQEMK